jgi:hypothetical protein
MAIGNQKQEITNRLKINLFTPSPGGGIDFLRSPWGWGKRRKSMVFMHDS